MCSVQEGNVRMDSVWKLVLAIIASIGGIGVVFTAVVAFTSNLIAERLQMKYDHRLNKELEKYKAGIDSKKYISKTKFDAEFSLYRSLSKAYFDMIKAVSTMATIYLQHDSIDKSNRDEIYNNAFSFAVIAQDELMSNAAFIPKGFYDGYEEIRRLCLEQIMDIGERWNTGTITAGAEQDIFKRDTQVRSTKIDQRFGKLNDEIREYLNSLDVLE